jgi:2,4-dienoyl-CoA reductase-like NADH-dependent reductase (Old Yellow Enzyme family)
VQVHSAHGYLLAQFLSPSTNRRTDEWGGDVPGRARALLESVRACRAATGPGFTIAVKLNSSDFRHGGFTEDDAEQVVRLLADEGVDLIEISGGTYESPALLGLAGASDASSPGSVKEAYFAAFATRARQAARSVTGGVPIMLTGGIRTRTAMTALLDSGAIDLVGMGRPLALDPELPRKLLAGEDGRPLPSYALPSVLGLAGESEWYEHQIGRLGDGQEPKPRTHALTAAARFVTGEARRGLLEGRRRRRLTASS